MDINYKKRAIDFCTKTGTVISVKYLDEVDRFEGDLKATGKRFRYTVTITRADKTFEFVFTDSIHNHDKGAQKDYAERIISYKHISPDVYDILACLQKYDCADFDDFCFDYGFEFKTEREYIKVKKIHFDVMDEYKNVVRLFGDVMDELREID